MAIKKYTLADIEAMDRDFLTPATGGWSFAMTGRR